MTLARAGADVAIADILVESDTSAAADYGVLAQAAWALATSPTASVRNGAEAVTLAERAVRLTGGPLPP